MLSKAAELIPTGSGLAIKPRWDGYRFFFFCSGCKRISAHTRHGLPDAGRFPYPEKRIAKALPGGGIVDSELVAGPHVRRPDPPGLRSTGGAGGDLSKPPSALASAGSGSSFVRAHAPVEVPTSVTPRDNNIYAVVALVTITMEGRTLDNAGHDRVTTES